MKHAPTSAPKGLSPLQDRFCTEYLVDLNGTKAYLRASPDASYDTASQEAHKLLTQHPLVFQNIQRLMDERATVTGITADRVLMRLWNIATADARRLTEYRIGSCRHCWGLYNQYQYTEAEFSPDGRPKLLHLWPVKLLQAGPRDCRSFCLFS